jgi:hypothetical protein
MVGITLFHTNASINLFPIGANWTFFEPDHDIGASWRNVDYTGDLANGGSPDGFWGFGSATFYFEANSAAVCSGGAPETALDVGYKSYYFRTRFTVPADTAASGSLNVRGFYDDGIIYYLNGKEIYRANMPSGTINYNTPCLAMVNSACHSTTISVTNLMVPLPGTNVFAAELHESASLTDADIYFDASADFLTTATLTSPLPPRLSIAWTAPATQIISWPTNVGGYHWILEGAADLLGTNSSWEPLSISSPFTNMQPSLKFFRSRVSP